MKDRYIEPPLLIQVLLMKFEFSMVISRSLLKCIPPHSFLSLLILLIKSTFLMVIFVCNNNDNIINII